MVFFPASHAVVFGGGGDKNSCFNPAFGIHTPLVLNLYQQNEYRVIPFIGGANGGWTWLDLPHFATFHNERFGNFWGVFFDLFPREKKHPGPFWKTASIWPPVRRLSGRAVGSVCDLLNLTITHYKFPWHEQGIVTYLHHEFRWFLWAN